MVDGNMAPRPHLTVGTLVKSVNTTMKNDNKLSEHNALQSYTLLQYTVLSSFLESFSMFSITVGI